jgi:hypothetical protein
MRLLLQLALCVCFCASPLCGEETADESIAKYRMIITSSEQVTVIGSEGEAYAALKKGHKVTDKKALEVIRRSLLDIDSFEPLEEGESLPCASYFGVEVSSDSGKASVLAACDKVLIIHVNHTRQVVKLRNKDTISVLLRALID